MKIFLLILSAILYSCGNNYEKVEIPDISGATKLIISYKANFDSTGKMITETREIRDVNQISEVRKFISEKPFPYLYCVYNGQLSFYKNDILLHSFVFNTDPSFRHIAFNQDNKIKSVELDEKSSEKLITYFKKK
ncbi:MAG TPA: hypothetical protein PLG90_11800 [Ignavibacteria bacterium]|nr:hypothetical protein [Ignavibacteria bacterium]